MRNESMKNIFRPLLFSAAITLGLSACSEASSADPIPAVEEAAGNWAIQPEGSHIRFSAKQEGEAFTGEFQSFSGVINFDPSAPQNGSVRITIPLKSVEAGSNDRNSTLPGKVWFSVKAFPNAVYTSSNITAEGSGYIAQGELTLKGVSVPLALPFSLDIQGGTAVMTSTVEMDRTDWSVGAAPWDTDEWVSKAVTLDIQVTAQSLN